VFYAIQLLIGMATGQFTTPAPGPASQNRIRLQIRLGITIATRPHPLKLSF
jgi:hypothetical protein